MTPANDGIEKDPTTDNEQDISADALKVGLPDIHQRLIQVELLDVTDGNNQLVHTKEWLLHGKDARHLSLRGNLFVAESSMTGIGKVFVKCAPLPHVRDPEGNVVDLTVHTKKGGGFEYLLHQTGPADLESWEVLCYEGGAVGRTRALHEWQQSLRPNTGGHRVPRFLSNSWGDRNRDARITHDFILEEIDAAADLGVEVVQIDDGWQKGTSANSSVAEEKGGVWLGFWDTDPDFWMPNPERFPQGLEPILERAAEKGVEIGLWYAPDSSGEFANWRRDVDQVLALHRKFGVNYFKLDSISAASIEARRNLRQMFDAIIDESGGKIVCDLDVTAGVRPGYFGEMECGPLFVENRYTDHHNYWPHFTLRNLWQLSHWIDPRRLRMELLNNSRNAEKYGGDPLAPALYPPATLFAMSMVSNPLGWFENTGLSAAFIDEVAPLARLWRTHREQLFAGDLQPIGQAPDGIAWTGFCSVNQDKRQGYAIVFNEKNSVREHDFELPAAFASADALSGPGRATIKGNRLTATIEVPFGYLFVKLG